MSKIFKILAAISLTIHMPNYLTTPCQGMDWIFSGDKKPMPKKFELTIQSTPEHITNAEMSQNFGFVSPTTFHKIFGSDDNIGYLRLFNEFKNRSKDFSDTSLRTSNGILSIKPKEKIDENCIILNKKMANYIRLVESNYGEIKNNTIAFTPTGQDHLTPAGYVHFDLLITPHSNSESLEIFGKVLDYQLTKKFKDLALTNAMNKIEFNFTKEELKNHDKIKAIRLTLTGYQNAPRFLDSSTKIVINLLNEHNIKIDKFSEQDAKTLDYLTKKKLVQHEPVDIDLDHFKQTFPPRKTNQSYPKGYDRIPTESEEPIEPEAPQIKKLNLDFKTLGIGGLNSQLDELKDALISRGINEEFRKRADFEHTKGIILYGPPGTGKTLIARKMAEILGVKEKFFKVINGPEILSKYVGESEKNMRELFELAENNPSELIVLFFDEIDAIARRRSSGNGTGETVGNNIVNQMLSKMDGVDSIKNILVIGATNRLDMIDPALIRPGRFDLKLCIDLPDEKGRRDIFDIHLKKIMANTMLKEVSPEKLINELALRTQNFTGAEIKGLCDTAKKLALQEVTNPDDLSKVDEKNYFVTRAHFLAALQKTNPAFGQQASNLEALLPATKIALPSQEEILTKLIIRMSAFRTGHVSSFLITGKKGTGKSTIAGFFAERTKEHYDLTRIIAPNILRKSFEDELNQLWLDAQRVKKSLIILDGLEHLLGILNDYKYDENAMRALNTILASKIQNQVTLLVTMDTNSLKLFRKINPMANCTYSQSVQNLNQVDLNILLETYGIKEDIRQGLLPHLQGFPLSLILDILNEQYAPTYTLSDWEKRIQEML